MAGFQSYMLKLAQAGRLPKGTSIDRLGNVLNLARQAKKRSGLRGRQWVRFRKALSHRERDRLKEGTPADPKFSTDTNALVW
jgi:hypothetical protein